LESLRWRCSEKKEKKKGKSGEKYSDKGVRGDLLKKTFLNA